MSNATESTAAPNPFLQPYVEFWEGWIEQTNETTKQFLQSGKDAASPRALQRRWLEATSRSIDAYLRSPMFLEAMKKNMDAVIRTKLQVNDFQKEVARNADIPTASDISGLFERLRGIEESILTRLGEIERRLESIENKQ